jgi:hypothetical protein
MNERIKELRSQAEGYALQIPASLKPHEFNEIFEEIFAELIVRECAHVALMSNGNNLHVFTLIKEHFGVEE